MSARAGTIALVAAPLVVLDLGQKASEPVDGHPRGLGYVALALVLCAAIMLIVPRVPSWTLAVSGGVAVAGVVGNAVSALAWRNGIPNPIVAGGLAFNIADVCVLVGSAGLVAGACLHALRNRHLLHHPV